MNKRNEERMQRLLANVEAARQDLWDYENDYGCSESDPGWQRCDKALWDAITAHRKLLNASN
tara:strand:- start:22248 stop:22433 length:186 start_codon:yes stop_codon:yes gene_type:complete